MADTYSNPLPPPSMRPPAAETPQPRSNADFRALLATPRAERGSYRSSFAGNGGGGGSSERKEQKKDKPKKAPKPKPTAEEDAAKEDDGSGYRDRAEERRKGINPDYDGGFSADLSAAPGGMQGANLTIDETKFLGGDVEHTHLVKGLDYALLQKVRTEENSKEAEEAEEARARAKLLKTKEFKTPLGRSVFDAIFRPPRRDVSQSFLPRRMAFVYDLEGGASLDIPTTLHRSKADCPKPVDSLMGGMDGAVLERLAKIMGYMRVAPGAKPKKLKKRDKRRMLESSAALAGLGAPAAGNGHAASANGAAQPGLPPPPQPAAPVDDDDIFGDVGADYELPEQRMADKKGAAKRDSYFDKKDEMGDLPALPTGEGGAVEAAADAVPPPPPDMPPPPPPPPPEDDAAPGAAMPPAGYNYDYSAAYAGADQQQWAQQGYDASVYGGAVPVQYDAYGQPIVYDTAVQGVEAAAAADGSRELTTEEKDAGLGSVFKRDDERLAKMRDQDEREKDPAFVSDAYAECYPAFHEFGTTVVDSDEEDMSHMDKKGEKGTSRANFATEEEWQANKAKQETLPKAAFQFGLKMADGRKSHKNLVSKANNKLKNELSSIKDILDKKGTSYGRAFDREADEAPSSGGGPAKRKRVI